VVLISSDESPLIAPEETIDRTWKCERLARGRLVHRAVSLNHVAVDRANLAWLQRQLVADRDPFDRHVFEAGTAPAVSDGRDALARAAPGGARHGHLLEGIPAREHQDDDRAREILMEGST
jgi:hypothetical protein